MTDNPAHPKGFGRPQDEPPTTWTNHPLRDRIKDAGGGIYYAVIKEPALEGSDVWVWHWHTPSTGEHRWALAACGLHTVEQADPLTLSPSLACEDGCPSHGYIENGAWRAV
jgi:hypothetical protein